MFIIRWCSYSNCGLVDMISHKVVVIHTFYSLYAPPRFLSYSPSLFLHPPFSSNSILIYSHILIFYHILVLIPLSFFSSRIVFPLHYLNTCCLMFLNACKQWDKSELTARIFSAIIFLHCLFVRVLDCFSVYYLSTCRPLLLNTHKRWGKNELSFRCFTAVICL